MIATVIVCFFALLVIGAPIAVLMLVCTAVGLAAFTSTSLMVLPQQLYNALDNSLLLCIPFFILAGSIMTEGAMARRLIAVINAFVGHYPGGLAVATTLACLFFACLSGSSPATVIAIGSVMIPALKKSGYNDRFAMGLTTSAGSLGVVIPPSIPMILYCMVMNVSVAKLFMAGIGPGLLIAATFIGYTLMMAYKNRWGVLPRRSWKETLTILRRGWWGLILPVIVLGGIYSGMFTPTEAGSVSVVYALLVELLIYREIKVIEIPRVCRQAAVLSGCLLFILASAMTLIWLLTAHRIPQQIADAITTHVHSGWVFLILANLLFLFMGTVMDNVSAMLILSPLFAETLQRFGIDPIHYGIIMVMVIEFGFLTPPFGLNLFVTMGLTNRSLTEVSAGVWPFLLLLLICLALVTFIPAISLFLPQTLLH